VIKCRDIPCGYPKRATTRDCPYKRAINYKGTLCTIN